MQFMFNNIKYIKRHDKVELIIYYKSPKLTSLVTRNDQSPQLEDLQKGNLIYEFKCNSGDCEHLNNSYVGQTQASLSQRLTMHKSSGAPKKQTNPIRGQIDFVIGSADTFAAGMRTYRRFFFLTRSKDKILSLF